MTDPKSSDFIPVEDRIAIFDMDGTLCCDDLVRENGNMKKADAMREDCRKNGWTAVSMRDDWTTIYGDNIVRKTK